MDAGLSAGTVLLGRYRVDAVVSRGRNSAIYRSTDLATRQVVAVKEMCEGVSDAELHARAVKQFQAEFAMLSRLRHQALPQVYAYHEQDDRHYLVMDFVEARSLDEVIQSHKTPPDQATVLAWLRQLLDVLEYLHSQDPPVIFRDLRPKNVLLTARNEVKLIDFGIARMDGGDSNRTLFRAVGSQEFAPPEQFGLGRSDVATDIYALGATVYNALTLALPPASTNRQVKKAPLLDLRKVNPTVSETLSKVVVQMLALKAAERPASIGQIRQALGLPRATPNAEPPPPPRTASGRFSDPTLKFPASGPAPTPGVAGDNVQFTVYRPTSVQPLVWYSLVAFGHLGEGPPDAGRDGPERLEEVMQWARQLLGPPVHPGQNNSLQSAPRGEITFQLTLPGFEVNPRQVSLLWLESAHMLAFRLRAGPALAGQTGAGSLTVRLGQIVIAEIPVAIPVESGSSGAAMRGLTRQTVRSASSIPTPPSGGGFQVPPTRLIPDEPAPAPARGPGGFHVPSTRLIDPDGGPAAPTRTRGGLYAPSTKTMGAGGLVVGPGRYASSNQSSGEDDPWGGTPFPIREKVAPAPDPTPSKPETASPMRIIVGLLAAVGLVALILLLLNAIPAVHDMLPWNKTQAPVKPGASLRVEAISIS